MSIARLITYLMSHPQFLALRLKLALMIRRAAVTSIAVREVFAVAAGEEMMLDPRAPY